MKQMWLKTVIAIAICLNFSACGKSKDSSSADPAPAATTPEKKDATTTGNTSKDGTKTNQGDQIKVLGGNTQNQPGIQSGAGSSAGNVSSTSASNGRGRAEGQVEQKQSESDEQIQNMLADAQKYSGSSADYLRPFLVKTQTEVKDEQQRIRNLKLANSIRTASLKVDHNGTGAVDLSILLADQREAIHLGGDFDVTRETKVQGRLGKLVMSGKLKCMDEVSADGATCENVVASINMQKSNVKIILRRTNIELKAAFPNANCKTKECEDMYKLFRQTELNVTDLNTVQSAKLETFEVIQGRSGFRLIVINKAKEVITAAGALLNPEKFQVTNLIADLSVNADDIMDLLKMNSYNTNMQSTLNDVRVTGNNGQGKITLQVNMKMLDNGTQDQFQIEAKRISRRIMPILETIPAKRLSLQ